METMINHNHNQVDRSRDDAIFRVLTPAVFDDQPCTINGAIPPHPEGADQPHPKRCGGVLIPTVSSHIDYTLETVLVEEVY